MTKQKKLIIRIIIATDEKEKKTFLSQCSRPLKQLKTYKKNSKNNNQEIKKEFF